ncbi:anaerobic ribonucleoside-triphosphate reductase activating protein [Candidatus Micrarchaeota archaeon]|nr:anaerobic ribonucleoside-triphosphate reductase activating protein [Candidatus Micrarchaeota archaeon]
MEFAYIQKTSLVDYPNKICSTLFTIGCNFRCPFCYNRNLVIPNEYIKERISEEKVLEILEKRKNVVDALCITGGEPLLHKDIVEFIRKVKSLGIQIKMDTNGTSPEKVKQLIDEKLVDYWATDVKTSKTEYPKATGLNQSFADKVEQSLKLIIDSGIPHDFRTTIVPGLHNDQIMEDIGVWLNSLGERDRYIIQTFIKPEGAELVDKSFNPGLFKQSEIQFLVNIAKPHFKTVEVRDYIYQGEY